MPAGQGAIIARKKKQRRREKLEKRARENEAQVDDWMSKYDKSKTSKLSQDEVRALLTDVKRDMLQDPTAEVAPELLEKIMKTFDLSGDGQIERTELVGAVKKYKALLRHQQRLKELFERHDKDMSGVLSPEQLLSLLLELAAEMPHHHASEADVEFVIDRCDKDKTRSINMMELGPAIATWKEAAQTIAPEPDTEKSSACVLL